MSKDVAITRTYAPDEAAMATALRLVLDCHARNEAASARSRPDDVKGSKNAYAVAEHYTE
jgi:hypothetical protein